MKVVLTQDIKGLGKKDSMVEVSDGHARNFLIPRKLAVSASNSNINTMKQKNEAEKSKKQREIAAAKELVQKLSEIKVEMRAKVGDNGKLFGSITSKEIAEKLLADHHLDIEKKKINMEEHIKQIGTYDIEIKVYPEISGKVKVVVEKL